MDPIFTKQMGSKNFTMKISTKIGAKDDPLPLHLFGGKSHLYK